MPALPLRLSLILLLTLSACIKEPGVEEAQGTSFEDPNDMKGGVGFVPASDLVIGPDQTLVVSEYGKGLPLHRIELVFCDFGVEGQSDVPVGYRGDPTCPNGITVRTGKNGVQTQLSDGTRLRLFPASLSAPSTPGSRHVLTFTRRGSGAWDSGGEDTIELNLTNGAVHMLTGFINTDHDGGTLARMVASELPGLSPERVVASEPVRVQCDDKPRDVLQQRRGTFTCRVGPR